MGLLLFYTCFLFFANGILEAAQTCGELRITYYTDADNTISCDIKLEPSSYMSDKLYRWNRYSLKLGSKVVINKETNYNINPILYNESDFTLHIRTLTSLDNDSNYVVECKMSSNEDFKIRSNQITIKLPPKSTTIPTSFQTTENAHTSTAGESTNGKYTALAVIVVALCVVVVAVVVATAIIVVNRRKQAVRDGNQGKRLVPTEESSVVNLPKENEESVYHEIDMDITQPGSFPDTNYSEIDAQFSNESLVSRAISPRLPKRPNEKGNTSDNHYSAIGVMENINNKEDSKYASVLPKSQRNTENREDATKQDANTSQNGNTCEYAKVVPKSQRNAESKENATQQHTGASQTDNNCEYAKVVPKSQRKITAPQDKTLIKDSKENTVKEKENNNEFTVQFPNINCDSITESLEETTNEDTERRAEYANIPRRSKRHMSKNRKNELLYIEIDHSGSELDLHNEFKLHLDSNKLDTEYTSIDFDKKAFVAPVRKAPSSWYKRRNKKNKKK